VSHLFKNIKYFLKIKIYIYFIWPLGVAKATLRPNGGPWGWSGHPKGHKVFPMAISLKKQNKKYIIILFYLNQKNLNNILLFFNK
jgi:hypothetical protein